MASFRTHPGAAAAFLIAVVLSLCTIARPTEFAGGTGEPNDPYQIATAEQLDTLGKQPELWGEHFVLTDDIDLAGRSYSNALLGQGNNSTHGFEGTAFTGVFDGQGHEIAGLVAMSDGEFMGLFGRIEPGASVRNLGVTDVRIRGRVQRIIRECGTGGLAGENWGEIRNCYTTGSISGTLEVGGLVGHNEGLITGCFSQAVVRGHEQVGGLVGNSTSSGVLSDCYSVGPIAHGSYYVGGLVGQNGGRIDRCYTDTRLYEPGNQWYGGLVGGGSGEVCQSFWNTQTSGLSASAGGVGLETAQMQDLQTFLNAGWDFMGETVNGTQDLWQILIEGDRPILRTFDGYRPPQFKGRGTASDPFLISTAIELESIPLFDPNACCRLVTDINLAGLQWSGAVIPKFSGTFDGSGHCISNLTITGGDWHLGLFGQLLRGARVRDLGIRNVKISDNGVFVGALAGVNYGTVARCFSTGSVQGTEYVGGLAGQNEGTLTICYSTVAVTARSRIAGGLAGSNSGGVFHCYSTGAVTGEDDIGGLVGGGRGVRWCYFLAQADDSGLDNQMGTVLTDAQMRQQTSFTDWDFWGTELDGIADPWFMQDGSYPVLTWQTDLSGLVPIPDVAGMTSEEAIEVLARAGFTPAAQARIDADAVIPQGRVLRTYPLFNAAPASVVEITVSAGAYDWTINEGNGTPPAPYRIQTAGQLDSLKDHPELWDRDFVLISDIDLYGRTYARALIAPDVNELENDFQGTAFAGTFDGGSHTIRNLTVADPNHDYLGLFGMIAAGGWVGHLALVNAEISGTYSINVGTLAGYNAGTLVECSATGIAIGCGNVRELAGFNSGSVINCSPDVWVKWRCR